MLKADFLELIYKTLNDNPEWVRDVVKAVNIAIKDEWIPAETEKKDCYCHCHYSCEGEAKDLKGNVIASCKCMQITCKHCLIPKHPR